MGSVVKKPKAGSEAGKYDKLADKRAAGVKKAADRLTTEEVDKSKIPAAQRKAKGGDWKVSKADLDKEESDKMSGKDGLEKLKKKQPL